LLIGFAGNGRADGRQAAHANVMTHSDTVVADPDIGSRWSHS
jgi:hypothetical protein